MIMIRRTLFRVARGYTFCEKNRLSREDLQKAHKEITEKMEKQGEDDNSYEKFKIKPLHVMAGGIGAFLIGLVLSFLQSRGLNTEQMSSQQAQIKLANRPKVQLGGHWSLIDTEGRRVSSRQLYDRYYVIYFGFAKCPDVCPNFLSRMARAMKFLRNMPQSRYLKLNVYFVSVDPQRDTPQKLKKFLNYFDPEIQGLSGISNDDIDLKDTMKLFRVYANKIPMKVSKTPNDYMIDHTALGFVMDNENQLALIIGPNMTGEMIARAITQDSTAKAYHTLKKVAPQA